MEDNQPKRDIPDCEYMGTVFMNPAIYVGEENNYKFIKTNTDIKCGELLLIEHVLANNNQICGLIIKYNEYLFNQFHPRTTNHQEAKKLSLEEIDNMVYEKASHNCFSLDKNLLLTNTITKMNHSCNPLCGVFIQENYTKENTLTIFMEVYALKNISANTELTINYGPKTAHNRDFTCDCGKTMEERVKHFEITTKLALCFSKTHNEIIREKICEYLNTLVAKRILLNHYLANNGVFVDKGNVSSFTTDGATIINNTVNSFMNLDPNKFNNEIYEGPMNETRLNLFVWILENNFFKA